MRNKMIELIENAPKHLAVISYADVFPRSDEVNAEFADYLIASFKKLDAEQGTGLTIRNLQLESEVKQLREKLEEKTPQWIPVSERLPEEREGWGNTFSDTVLVAHKRHDGSIGIMTSCTINGKWHSDVQHIQYEITHWMPLPELTKGE